MAKVLGVGGVFFRASDPQAVMGWHAEVLGLEVQDWGGVQFRHPDRGFVMLSPFPADTTYFEPSSQSVMVNLIVDDLEGVLARAHGHGVEPVGRDDTDPNGRFAWLMDPQGYKIELWEPAAGDAGSA